MYPKDKKPPHDGRQAETTVLADHLAGNIISISLGGSSYVDVNSAKNIFSISLKKLDDPLLSPEQKLYLYRLAIEQGNHAISLLNSKEKFENDEDISILNNIKETIITLNERYTELLASGSISNDTFQEGQSIRNIFAFSSNGGKTNVSVISEKQLTEKQKNFISSSLKEAIKLYFTCKNNIFFNQEEFLKIKQSDFFVELTVTSKSQEQSSPDENTSPSMATKTVLKLEDLFRLEERLSVQDLNILDTKRQLLLGKAGSGKSSLCKEIVRCWTGEEGYPEEFKKQLKQIDWVIYIDLKSLEKQIAHNHSLTSHNPEKNVIAFIFEEYSLGGVDWQDFKLFFREVIKKQTIKWILDGFDEVAHYLDKTYFPDVEKSFRNLLYYLIRQKDCFITSRFTQGQLLEIEKINKVNVINEVIINHGFSYASIEQYIKELFKGKEELADNLIKDLNDEANFHIKALAHTPILLKYICYLWLNTPPEQHSEVLEQWKNGMTGLYQAIIIQIFQAHLRKNNHIEPGTYNSQAITENFLSHYQDEYMLIKNLAFLGMKKGEIILDRTLIKEAIEKYTAVLSKLHKYQNYEFFLNAVLKIYGLLEAEKNSYVFSHYSLQEYLAAEIWVEAMVDKKHLYHNEAKDLFTKKLYNPDLELTWQFVAGILNCKQDQKYEKLKIRFWKQLLHKYYELTGYGIKLLIACLEEVTPENFLIVENGTPTYDWWLDKIIIPQLLPIIKNIQAKRSYNYRLIGLRESIYLYPRFHKRISDLLINLFGRQVESGKALEILAEFPLNSASIKQKEELLVDIILEQMKNGLTSDLRKFIFRLGKDCPPSLILNLLNRKIYLPNIDEKAIYEIILHFAWQFNAEKTLHMLHANDYDSFALCLSSIFNIPQSKIFHKDKESVSIDDGVYLFAVFLKKNKYQETCLLQRQTHFNVMFDEDYFPDKQDENPTIIKLELYSILQFYDDMQRIFENNTDLKIRYFACTLLPSFNKNILDKIWGLYLDSDKNYQFQFLHFLIKNEYEHIYRHKETVSLIFEKLMVNNAFERCFSVNYLSDFFFHFNELSKDVKFYLIEYLLEKDMDENKENIFLTFISRVYNDAKIIEFYFSTFLKKVNSADLVKKVMVFFQKTNNHGSIFSFLKEWHKPALPHITQWLIQYLETTSFATPANPDIIRLFSVNELAKNSLLKEEILLFLSTVTKIDCSKRNQAIFLISILEEILKFEHTDAEICTRILSRIEIIAFYKVAPRPCINFVRNFINKISKQPLDRELQFFPKGYDSLLIQAISIIKLYNNQKEYHEEIKEAFSSLLKFFDNKCTVHFQFINKRNIYAKDPTWVTEFSYACSYFYSRLHYQFVENIFSNIIENYSLCSIEQNTFQELLTIIKNYTSFIVKNDYDKNKNFFIKIIKVITKIVTARNFFYFQDDLENFLRSFSSEAEINLEDIMKLLWNEIIDNEPAENFNKITYLLNVMRLVFSLSSNKSANYIDLIIQQIKHFYGRTVEEFEKIIDILNMSSIRNSNIHFIKELIIHFSTQPPPFVYGKISDSLRLLQKISINKANILDIIESFKFLINKITSAHLISVNNYLFNTHKFINKIIPALLSNIDPAQWDKILSELRDSLLILSPTALDFEVEIKGQKFPFSTIDAQLLKKLCISNKFSLKRKSSSRIYKNDSNELYDAFKIREISTIRNRLPLRGNITLDIPSHDQIRVSSTQQFTGERIILIKKTSNVSEKTLHSFHMLHQSTVNLLIERAGNQYCSDLDDIKKQSLIMFYEVFCYLFPIYIIQLSISDLKLEIADFKVICWLLQTCNRIHHVFEPSIFKKLIKEYQCNFHEVKSGAFNINFSNWLQSECKKKKIVSLDPFQSERTNFEIDFRKLFSDIINSTDENLLNLFIYYLNSSEEVVSFFKETIQQCENIALLDLLYNRFSQITISLASKSICLIFIKSRLEKHMSNNRWNEFYSAYEEKNINKEQLFKFAIHTKTPIVCQPIIGNEKYYCSSKIISDLKDAFYEGIMICKIKSKTKKIPVQLNFYAPLRTYTIDACSKEVVKWKKQYKKEKYSGINSNFFFNLKNIPYEINNMDWTLYSEKLFNELISKNDEVKLALRLDINTMFVSNKKYEIDLGMANSLPFHFFRGPFLEAALNYVKEFMHHFTYLDFSNNRLKTEGIQMILNTITTINWNKIRRLNLSNNFLTKENLIDLLQAFEKVTSLRNLQIDLKNNSIKFDDLWYKDNVLPLLFHNKGIAEIDLDLNNVEFDKKTPSFSSLKIR